MLRTTKALALAVTLALVAIAATAGTAGATTAFTIERAGAIESASEGKLTFQSGETRIECRVTLRGSLRTGPINLRAREKFGEITGSRIEECNGGTVERVLVSEREPWELQFERLLGTLPEAVTGTLFNIVRAKFQLAVFGGFVRCLYEGTAGALLRLTRTGAARYSTGRIEALAASVYRLIRGGGCPAEGRMSGRFNLTPVQTITLR